METVAQWLLGGRGFDNKGGQREGIFLRGDGSVLCLRCAHGYVPLSVKPDCQGRGNGELTASFGLCLFVPAPYHTQSPFITHEPAVGIMDHTGGVHSLISFLSVHTRLSAQYFSLKRDLNFVNHLINTLVRPNDTSLSHFLCVFRNTKKGIL